MTPILSSRDCLAKLSREEAAAERAGKPTPRYEDALARYNFLRADIDQRVEKFNRHRNYLWDTRRELFTVNNLPGFARESLKASFAELADLWNLLRRWGEELEFFPDAWEEWNEDFQQNA